MKKDIYKIENKINHKVYIGQSNNVKERWVSHCVPSAANHAVVSRAIQKYGKENFDFSVIESDVENYDERECYWIKYYDCIVPKGYNVTNGGQNGYDGLTGEQNPTNVYTQSQIDKVKYLLKNTNYSYTKICEETGIKTPTTIGYINTGEQWQDNLEEHPLRKPKDIDSMIDDIIIDLKNRLLESEIEKKFGIGHTTIDKINKGEIYRRENELYPIRKPSDVGKKYLIKVRNAKIAQDISDTNKTFRQIHEEHQCPLCVVYKINNGDLKVEGYDSYPIRQLQTHKNSSQGN